MDYKQVKLVGIGLEELGVEEFVAGKYFTGDLYIDLNKDSYKKLGFGRLNIFSVFPAILGKKFREINAKTKEKKIEGNMKGDGFQKGGAMVVDKGGKALLTYKQDDPAEHVDPNEVLKALGIEAKIDFGDTPVPECGGEDGACALPKKK